MEAENARVGVEARREEMVERPGPGAGALEGPDKVLGPEADVLRLHRVRHVQLFRRIDAVVERRVDLADERVVDVGILLARLETEAGRVPAERHLAEEPLPELDPVADDAELAGLVIEEAVEVAGDDLVDVEEERRPLQVRKARLEDAELDVDIRPAVLLVGVEVLHLRRTRRNRLRVDALGKSRRIVRHADKPKWTLQMRLDPAVDAVDILRRIERTPLEGQNVNRFHKR